MKKFSCIFALLLGCVFTSHAQPSAGKIARKIVPPPAPPSIPAAPVRQNPPAQNNASNSGTTPAPNVPAVHQQSAAEKAEGTKKAVEFQKKRAAEGVASAQYDLGVRYMKGDGVEKNLDEARKWLDASAKQGNSMAAKKLEELKNVPQQ